MIIELSKVRVNVSALKPETMEYLHGYVSAGPFYESISVTPEDIAFERIKAARENEL